MKKMNQNDGSKNQGSSNANEKGENLTPMETSFVPCFKCKSNSVQDFLVTLALIDQLPTEEKIIALVDALYKMELKESINHLDFKECLKTMIAFEKVKLEKDQVKREKELAIKEARKKADEASNKLIPVDFPKLLLELDENELAVLFGDFILMTKNKSGHPIYVGERRRLAEWICAVIILLSNRPLNINTILNDLSTKEEIKEKIAKAALEDAKKNKK